jgi:hypothetical protein
VKFWREKSLKRAADRLRRKDKVVHGPRTELDGVIERFVAEMRKKPENGPDWNMNVHVEKFLYLAKGDLDLWVKAEIEMPVLRHAGTGTLVRSDGRVTMAAVILSNLCAMDYTTCNVGTPEPDEKGRPWHWKGRSITFHEDVTGRNGCKDAMQGLYERGCMSRFPQFDVDADYEIHNRASVRHFYPDFFRGMTDKIWEGLQTVQEALSKTASEVKEKAIELAGALGRTAARGAEVARKKLEGSGKRSKENEKLWGDCLAAFGLRPKPAPS